MKYIYLLLVILVIYYIFSFSKKTSIEKFDPSLVPVSSIITLAKVAQKLVDGNGTLTNPPNLQIGIPSATGKLTVTGDTDVGGKVTINSRDDANKFNFASSGGYLRIQNGRTGADIVTVEQGGADIYMPSTLFGTNINTTGNTLISHPENKSANIVLEKSGITINGDALNTTKPSWGSLSLTDKTGNSWAFCAGATSFANGGLTPNALNLYGYAGSTFSQIATFANNGPVSFSSDLSVGGNSTTVTGKLSVANTTTGVPVTVGLGRAMKAFPVLKDTMKPAIRLGSNLFLGEYGPNTNHDVIYSSSPSGLALQSNYNQTRIWANNLNIDKDNKLCIGADTSCINKDQLNRLKNLVNSTQSFYLKREDLKTCTNGWQGNITCADDNGLKWYIVPY